MIQFLKYSQFLNIFDDATLSLKTATYWIVFDKPT